MANSIRGLIKSLSNVEIIESKRTHNTVKKQTLLLDCTRHDPYTGANYAENIIPLEFVGTLVDQLSAFAVGDIVEVSFTIYGRTFTKDDCTVRRFVQINPYKIAPVRLNRQMEATTNPQSPTSAAPTAEAVTPMSNGFHGFYN